MQLFYMLMGMIVIGSVLLFIYFIQTKHWSVKWYDWVVGGLGLLLFIFSLQNMVTAFQEEQAFAAGMYLVFPGIVALIMLAVAALGVFRRSKRTAT